MNQSCNLHSNAIFAEKNLQGLADLSTVTDENYHALGMCELSVFNLGNGDIHTAIADGALHSMGHFEGYTAMMDAKEAAEKALCCFGIRANEAAFCFRELP